MLRENMRACKLSAVSRHNDAITHEELRKSNKEKIYRADYFEVAEQCVIGYLLIVIWFEPFAM